MIKPLTKNYIITQSGQFIATNKIGRMFYFAVKRLSNLFCIHGVEKAEELSIACALFWFLPLCIYPWYLSTSPYLRSIEGSISRDWLMLMTGILFVFQFGAIVLGGRPSSFINRDSDELLWLGFRRFGLFLAGWLWISLSCILFTSGVVGFGTLFFGWVSIRCYGGALRLGQPIADVKAERAYRKCKAIAEAGGGNG